MGAIASGGVGVLDRELVASLRLPLGAVEAVARRERRELERRERLYRGDRPAPDVTGKTVVLVDDGLATGSTMQAAVTALRRLRPARVVVAVPIASVEACAEFRSDVDECVCAATPEPFHGVGAWYEDFSQTSDEEVRELLAGAGRPAARERC